MAKRPSKHRVRSYFDTFFGDLDNDPGDVTADAWWHCSFCGRRCGKIIDGQVYITDKGADKLIPIPAAMRCPHCGLLGPKKH